MKRYCHGFVETEALAEMSETIGRFSLGIIYTAGHSVLVLCKAVLSKSGGSKSLFCHVNSVGCITQLVFLLFWMFFFPSEYCVYIIIHTSTHCSSCFFQDLPFWASVSLLHDVLLPSTGFSGITRNLNTNSRKYSYPLSGPSWQLHTVFLISPLPGTELLNLAQAFVSGFFHQMPSQGQCDK